MNHLLSFVKKKKGTICVDRHAIISVRRNDGVLIFLLFKFLYVKEIERCLTKKVAVCVCVCVHTCIYVQRSFLKTLSIKQNDVASIIKNNNVTNRLNQKDIYTHSMLILYAAENLI